MAGGGRKNLHSQLFDIFVITFFLSTMRKEESTLLKEQKLGTAPNNNTIEYPTLSIYHDCTETATKSKLLFQPK
jgi:hypothetical protein